LAVADFDTRAARRYEMPRSSCRGLVATPDGKTLYLLAHLFDGPTGAEVWRFDAATLKRRGTFARHKDEPWEMVGSADGRKLATGKVVRSETIRVWDTTDPDRQAVAIRPKRRATRFALSADGSHLATVGTKGVTLWNAATGREAWASGKHRRGVVAVCFSPTRPLLASGDNAGNVFLWDFAGNALTRYDWGLGDVYGLAFAPDGLRCAAAGTEKVVLWDMDV
jgi:WD40 repeat protein